MTAGPAAMIVLASRVWGFLTEFFCAALGFGWLGSSPNLQAPGRPDGRSPVNSPER